LKVAAKVERPEVADGWLHGITTAIVTIRGGQAG
jgi:hypothetical protein